LLNSFTGYANSGDFKEDLKEIRRIREILEKIPPGDPFRPPVLGLKPGEAFRSYLAFNPSLARILARIDQCREAISLLNSFIDYVHSGDFAEDTEEIRRIWEILNPPGADSIPADEIPSDKRLKWTKPGEQKRPDFRVKKDIVLKRVAGRDQTTDKVILEDDSFYVKAGTLITDVEVMDFGTKIQDHGRLIDTYKIPAGTTARIENGKEVKVQVWRNTNPADWKKVKGITYVTDGKITRKIEMHWYQCKNIGIVEPKRKGFL
jgi:hypothetical protein